MRLNNLKAIKDLRVLIDETLKSKVKDVLDLKL